MEDLPVERLRIRTAEYVARAELGEAFVVVRHQRPLAVLGPYRADQEALTVPVSRFRGSLRVWLGRAKGRPLQLTWRGRIVASVEPVDETRSLRWDWT